MRDAIEARVSAPYERAVLLIISDTHCGHKFGLLSPGVTLYDETPYGDYVPFHPKLTSTQELILDLLTETVIPATNMLAGNDPVVLLHLGDLVHGNKYPDEIISSRIADQIEIGGYCMRYIIDGIPGTKIVRLVAGTGAHEFGEGSAALMVARWLADIYAQKGLDVRPLLHGLSDFYGCRIDYTHHGPAQSKRRWLEGNLARYYLNDIMERELESGRQPADLYLRGHIHTPVNEVVSKWQDNRWVESRILVAPPLCGLSNFARQVMRGIFQVTFGAVLIEIEHGKPQTPYFLTRTIDIRTKETFA